MSLNFKQGLSFSLNNKNQINIHSFEKSGWMIFIFNGFFESYQVDLT